MLLNYIKTYMETCFCVFMLLNYMKTYVSMYK